MRPTREELELSQARADRINLADAIRQYGADLDQFVREGDYVSAVGMIARIDRATVSLRHNLHSQLDRLARI